MAIIILIFAFLLLLLLNTYYPLNKLFKRPVKEEKKKHDSAKAFYEHLSSHTEVLDKDKKFIFPDESTYFGSAVNRYPSTSLYNNTIYPFHTGCRYNSGVDTINTIVTFNEEGNIEKEDTQGYHNSKL